MTRIVKFDKAFMINCCSHVFPVKSEYDEDGDMEVTSTEEWDDLEGCTVNITVEIIKERDDD